MPSVDVHENFLKQSQAVAGGGQHPPPHLGFGTQSRFSVSRTCRRQQNINQKMRPRSCIRDTQDLRYPV